MGSGGVPNRTIVRIDGRPGDLPTKNVKPNSRYDLYYNGKKIQSRWFDKNGKVVRNRDISHQDPFGNHTFPHDHIWSDGVRISENLTPDYENFN